MGLMTLPRTLDHGLRKFPALWYHQLVGVADLVREKSAGTDAALRARRDETMAAMQVMMRRAETIEAYDQMTGEGNDAGNTVAQNAIDALLNQTRAIERGVCVLDLQSIAFEGSENLATPDKVK